MLWAGAVAAPARAPSAARKAVARTEMTVPRDSARSRRHVARSARPDTARVQLGAEGAGGEAFVAYPAGQEPAPGIVVVHEWWGLNAQIREFARRLAQQGYVVIIPDLYRGKVANDAESAHVLARGLDEGAALDQLRAAASWLAAGPRTGKRRRGVLGFCMGGRLALQSALQDEACSGVVMFYGTPESRPDRIAPLKAPLLAHYGADDQGIDLDRVETFERVLKAAGKNAEVFVYPGAGHAFMNEDQAGYRPEAARLAWIRTLDFLQKNLKGRP